MENKNRDYEACLKTPSKYSCCLNTLNEFLWTLPHVPAIYNM